jgi:hypothetical protein
MNKNTKTFLAGFALIFLTLIIVVFIRSNFTKGGDSVPGMNVPDALNVEIKIKDEIFVLKNGKAENEIVKGSATKNKLMVFGEPVYGDLDNDGDKDATMLLENDPGGSGTFYYAVLVINNGNDGFKATNVVFLGDRVAPQTVEIHDGRALFNYAVRKGDEPMTAQPSIGKSLWINLDKNTGEIGEWVKDFEGESR